MTKVYDVGMEVLQKLYEFQSLLKKRKFGKAYDKIEFLAFVQIKCETVTIPVIKPILVANASILIEEGLISIPKYRILKIEKDDNHVVVKFKIPIFGLGSFIYFHFKTELEKNDFLDAIGEIENDESDVEKPEVTPSSDDNSN